MPTTPVFAKAFTANRNLLLNYGRCIMRSVIVSAALITRNRFELCHLAFRAIRKLHKPSTRIADTANDALLRLAGAEINNLPEVSGAEEKPEPLATEAPPAASQPKSLAAAGEPDSDPTAAVFRTDEIDEDEDKNDEDDEDEEPADEDGDQKNEEGYSE